MTSHVEDEIDRLWRASMTPGQRLMLETAEDALQRLRSNADAVKAQLAEKRAAMMLAAAADELDAAQSSEFAEMVSNAEQEFMTSTAPARSMISDLFATLPPKPIVAPAAEVRQIGRVRGIRPFSVEIKTEGGA